MSPSLPRRVARAVPALAVLVLTLPFVDCRKGLEDGKPLRRTKERVFVMGFDGMDPTLARRWMDEGKLPNLEALADEGTFARLASTQPSESPTAWSSFATGVNPGKHGIYDFLVRDLETYFPDLNMVRRPREPPRFLWGLIPREKFNGYLKRLLFDAGVCETLLRGPQSPVLWHEEAALKGKKTAGSLSDKEQARLDELATGKDLNLPMTVRWTAGSGRADVEIQGRRLSIKAGDWSEWVPLTFKVSPFSRIHGMTQFHVIQADRELRLYASPVNLDPRDPPLPISAPESFSADLAEKIGLYRTLGWAESADKPLNDGRLDEAEFLYDSDRAMDDREKLILENLKRDDWDLFVAAIETTDRISHMMWRLIDPRHPMYDAALAAKYGDAIERVYRRADDFVGRLRAKQPKDVVFMVMSDHGFHSFRREVNLNTWLVQNGYMALRGAGPGTSLADLYGRGRFFEGVDWAHTKAYAVGLGQIYFNLRGRESQGIVSPGQEYRELQEEIRQKLLPLTDPETGERVFTDIYRRDDIYEGEYIQMAPDLEVGFLDGYRVGWQDTTGGIRRAVIENNNKKWSGDHCATASEISHGVFFCSRKIADPAPNIMDVAPSVLKLLGTAIPADYDGKPLW